MGAAAEKAKANAQNDKVTANGANGEDLYDSIVEAIKTGLQKAEVPVYMDGKKVTDIVNRFLGSDAQEGRFA